MLHNFGRINQIPIQEPMLENWLAPIDKKFHPTHGNHDIYRHLSVYHDKMPNLKDIPIVIVGLDETAMAIRKEFYHLAWHFNDIPIADLGNMRNPNDDSTTQVLTELIDGDILPIIIGGIDHNPIPQFLAHKGLRQHNNIAIVNQRIPFSLNGKDYLNSILDKYSKSVFNIGFLGYQSHFIPSETLTWLDKQRYDGLRLGHIKSDIEDAEPIIRDADMMFFQLDALKASDCPGHKNPCPNGLTGEEACQLAKYAGMSNKLCSFGLSGYTPSNDQHGLGAQQAAQILWYFIQGFCSRKGDYPYTETNMTEYIIDAKGYGKHSSFTFWKSNNSGRWWVQLPRTGELMKRHRLVPCSYKDYKNACNGEFPDRLLWVMDRIIP